MIDTPNTHEWIVLDAKYSQSRSAILDAMNSAHVYHDALRWRGMRPRRSLLLVPACPTDLGWLQSNKFQDEHGVGVLMCTLDTKSSEAQVGELRAVLNGIVGGNLITV
jgi:hypothetical protein